MSLQQRNFLSLHRLQCPSLLSLLLAQYRYQHKAIALTGEFELSVADALLLVQAFTWK